MGIRGTVFRMCIILIMAFYSAASAEIKVRSIDVTPFMGVYLYEHNMYVDLDHRMHTGGRLGYNITENWGVEATGGYVSTETAEEFTTEGGRFIPINTECDFWTFHLDALYNFFPEEQVNPYLAIGGGAYNIDIHHMDSNIDPLFNWGIGLKYFLTEWVAFRVDARHLISVNELDNFDKASKDLHNNVTMDAGLNFSLWGEGADKDKDGIPNKKDSCPEVPEDKDGFEDIDGCPDLDNDNDGIVDLKDKCPNEAEDKDGFMDEDGCPDPDNDNDRILDTADKCPNEAEVYNGFEDEDGCPDKFILKKNDTITLDNVYFKSGKADLVEASFAALDKVKAIFTDNPGIKIQIEGHTDSQGSAAYNKNLSQKRCETVMKYLIDKLGIPKNQLTAKGFGEEKPVADNKTEEGRAKNRRIEFRVR